MANPIQSCRAYLERLKAELATADPALIQDALNDTQDFINGEREAFGAAESADTMEENLVRRLIENFGTPEEVAEAYLETESVVAAAMSHKRVARPAEPADPPMHPSRSAALRRAHAARAAHGKQGILGIFTDPRAYGAAFFILLALPTGVILFCWVVTGLALSLGLSLLLLGFPFALLFLATLRVLALVEGRMVETLLGERMPRRSDSSAPGGSWLARLKFWVTDRRTWSTIVYMLLRLPAGVISFTILLVLLSILFECLAGPFISLTFDLPFITIDDYELYASVWMIPVGWILAAGVALLTLYSAAWMGRVFAFLAKSMLVRT